MNYALVSIGTHRCVICHTNQWPEKWIYYCFIWTRTILSIRAGWVMTGLTFPPPEIFFLQKDTSGDFLDTPGPKKTHLGHFSGFSGVSSNTWQLPGVSRCILGVSKKKFSGQRPEKIFFHRVSQPPLKFFFRKLCVSK